MHRLIISAPFGVYFRTPGVTSTLGTYTVARRAGPLKRLWRVLSTVRYHPRTQSWVNRLGLPNPGIASLTTARDCILSVHGFNADEWATLMRQAGVLDALAVELNLSCPNVEHRGQMLQDVVWALPHARVPVIAKLPPVRWMDLAVPLHAAGVRCFHLCNSMPTAGGGMSGKPLKQYSLWAVEDLRQRWGLDVTLIGGGGVTSAEDVDEYLRAGADHVAIGSALLNPFNWGLAGRLRDYLAAEGVAQ